MTERFVELSESFIRVYLRLSAAQYRFTFYILRLTIREPRS